MDVILAVVVVVVVIMFGALLTRGNAIFSKAILDLNTVARDWAIADLKIKKAKLATVTKVDNKEEWAAQILKRILGESVSVKQIYPTTQRANPEYINVSLADGRRVILTPGSPEMLRAMKNGSSRGGAARQLSDASSQVHPLIPFPRKVEAFQLDDLSCGIEFDAQSKQVWKEVTKEALVVDTLWAYILPS
jgi:hypothetical protein